MAPYRSPCPRRAPSAERFSAPASSPTIILDAGPLIAAVNRAEPDAHRWVMEQFAALRGGFIVTSAAVAEATHLMGNAPAALEQLRRIVGRMTVEDPAPVDVLAVVRYTASARSLNRAITDPAVTHVRPPWNLTTRRVTPHGSGRGAALYFTCLMCVRGEARHRHTKKTTAWSSPPSYHVKPAQTIDRRSKRR